VLDAVCGAVVLHDLRVIGGHQLDTFAEVLHGLLHRQSPEPRGRSAELVAAAALLVD
jgi:hypothetical protein